MPIDSQFGKLTLINDVQVENAEFPIPIQLGILILDKFWQLTNALLPICVAIEKKALVNEEQFIKHW